MDQNQDNMEITTEEMEKQFKFGLRLSTAAQLMQGMLSCDRKPCDSMVRSAVRWADDLIRECEK